MSTFPGSPDVVIVGAGPAGLAAAVALRQNRALDVLVVDRDDAPGGLPRYCNHPGFGWEFTRRMESGPAFARRMIRLAGEAGATIATRTTAVAVSPGPAVELVGPVAGHRVVHPRALLFVTGVRETSRGGRLVPGRRPFEGIYTTGQLQQSVVRDVAMPKGARVAIVGSEHVSFSAILTARKAGMTPVVMVEGSDRIRSFKAAGAISKMLYGIEVVTGAQVVDIEGRECPSAIVVETAGGIRRVVCDAIVFTGGWRPDCPILQAAGIQLDPGTRGPIIDQFMQTGMSGVFAAGNVLRGVESSGRAALEGARAGACILEFLNNSLPTSQASMPIQIESPIAYVCPQRWTVEPCPSIEPLLIPSVRLDRDVPKGRIRLSNDKRVLWQSRPGQMLAGRRIPLDLGPLQHVCGGSLTISLQRQC